MKKSALLAVTSIVLLAPTLWASKAEELGRKVDKELKKISLTAAVIDGRRVVNRVMAEQLAISRKQLVEDRRATGFVYGQLFGAHEVARGAGLTFKQVAEHMKQGRSLLEISQQHQVNLKQFLRDAKELNKRIDKELDRVASGEEIEDAEDTADSYEPSDDSLIADTADFTPLEITQADAQVHRRGIPSIDGGTLSPGRGIGGEMGGPSLGRGAGVGGIGGGRGRGPR